MKVTCQGCCGHAEQIACFGSGQAHGTQTFFVLQMQGLRRALTANAHFDAFKNRPGRVGGDLLSCHCPHETFKSLWAFSCLREADLGECPRDVCVALRNLGDHGFKFVLTNRCAFNHSFSKVQRQNGSG